MLYNPFLIAIVLILAVTLLSGCDVPSGGDVAEEIVDEIGDAHKKKYKKKRSYKAPKRSYKAPRRTYKPSYRRRY